MHKQRKLCLVCHQLGDSVHFGAISCKACAAFFRRTTVMKLYNKYTCRMNNDECVVTSRTRDNCKACRYKKCLLVGMNQEEVQKVDHRSQNTNVNKLPPYLVPKLDKSCTKMFNINIDQFSSITPTLYNIFEGYRILCQKRSQLHNDNTIERNPKAATHLEFCHLYIKDVCLQYEFLENTFPEYQSMNIEMKRQIFKYFFVSFLILEIGYRTYLNSENGEMILVNGDYIDIMKPDTFYYDPEKRQNCKPDDAIKMYQPTFDQIRRNVYQPFLDKKPNIIEFLSLVSLSLWNTSIEGNPEWFYDICNTIRAKVIRDLKIFYERSHSNGSDEDPLLKLSNLLLLLPSVERSVELFVAHVEFKNAFRCFAFHNKLYELMNGV